MSLNRSIMVPLLEKYFTVVKDLRTYLTEILELPSPLSGAYSWDAKEADSTHYRDLLNSSYVALKVPADVKLVVPRFKVFPVMTDMREVSRHQPGNLEKVEHAWQIIDRAQEKLFKSKAPQHVITAGYRIVSCTGVVKPSF